MSISDWRLKSTKKKQNLSKKNCLFTTFLSFKPKSFGYLDSPNIVESFDNWIKMKKRVLTFNFNHVSFVFHMKFCSSFLIAILKIVKLVTRSRAWNQKRGKIFVQWNCFINLKLALSFSPSNKNPRFGSRVKNQETQGETNKEKAGKPL